MRFGNSDKIQFISTVEGLDSFDECLPRLSKNFIPEWFKNIPSTNPLSVRNCPSFPDYFSQGYILPMWSDAKLTYDGFNWNWSTPTKFNGWSAHLPDQFLNYIKPNFNGVEGQFIFKALCPWRVITPPGWSVLQLPLFYHFNQEWSVLPGVIDTDIHHEINQQVLYHGNGKEITINCGDPFVLYVPFKRSNKLKSIIRNQTKKDIQKFKEMSIPFTNKFIPTGYYRKLQRTRDKT